MKKSLKDFKAMSDSLSVVVQLCPCTGFSSFYFTLGLVMVIHGNESGTYKLSNPQVKVFAW